MKTVCIDARMAGHSGIGTYIRNILSHLKTGPFKLKLFVHPAGLQKYPELEIFESVSVASPIYSLQEQLKLPFLVPSCDLFWSPHFNIPMGKIRAKKRMVTIHDVYPFAYREGAFLKKALAKVIANQAIKKSDLVLTVSEFSKEEIIKYTGVASQKVEVIHLGINQIHFSPHLEGIEAVRKKYALPEQFVLFVSILSLRKNIEGLLRAFDWIRREFPNVKLVLVGREMAWQGWKESLVKNQELAKQVVILGEVDGKDLPLLYRAAILAVHPSFYEGFGLTPLEAMASGCPVVVSKVASLPEVCGSAALYVDPYDIGSIAKGLSRLLKDPALRAEQRERGLRQCQQFRWDRAAERHIELMERVISGAD